MELPAAPFEERVPPFNADFIDGFDTVGSKARAKDIYAMRAGRAEFSQCFRGMWSDPLLSSELRLKRHSAVVCVKAQRLGKQCARLEALRVVGVATLDSALR